MSDIEQAAPENSSIYLRDNETEVKQVLIHVRDFPNHVVFFILKYFKDRFHVINEYT